MTSLCVYIHGQNATQDTYGQCTKAPPLHFLSTVTKLNVFSKSDQPRANSQETVHGFKTDNLAGLFCWVLHGKVV